MIYSTKIFSSINLVINKKIFVINYMKKKKVIFMAIEYYFDGNLASAGRIWKTK